MNSSKTSFFKLGWLLALLLAGSIHAWALDGAVVIANDGISTASLSASDLKNIYTGKTKYWDNGQAVIIVVLSDKTDAALQQASGMDAGSFKTFWQRLAFSGRGQAPKTTDTAAATVAKVASTKGAIALVPSDTDIKGVKEIKIQ